MRLVNLVRSECWKLFTLPSTWVIAAAMTLGTWGMSYINSYGSADIAPDDPRLFSSVPIPAGYAGFDMAGWGFVFVVALGSLWGSGEYGRGGQIRTTLAATPRRGRVFVAKALLVGLLAGLLGFLSMAGGVMVTHMLARDGIDPVTLSPAVWRHLASLSYSWAMIALLCFALAVLARSAVLPLALMLPMVVGVGGFLARLAPAFRLLPTVTAESTYMYAGSGSYLNATAGMIASGLWAAVSLVVAGAVFANRDGA